MMDNVRKEIVIENKKVRIVRFTFTDDTPKEKQIATIRLNKAALKYGENSENSYSIFTDITNSLHLLLEEQL